MAHPYFRKPGDVDVDAAQLETRPGALIQPAVHGDERGAPGRIDRAVDDRDQVQVADVRHIVPGRQGSRDEKVGDPAQPDQLVGERLDDGR
jgi:hypothetical protein